MVYSRYNNKRIIILINSKKSVKTRRQFKCLRAEYPPCIQQPTKSFSYKPREVEIQIFQTTARPHIYHLIKETCLGASYTKSSSFPSEVSIYLLQVEIRILRHVTPKDYSVGISCIFMSVKSSLRVTTLRSLVTIGILRVNRKNASSKTRIL